MYQKEANRGMQPDEEAFNVPVPLTQKVKSTTDSYIVVYTAVECSFVYSIKYRFYMPHGFPGVTYFLH